MHRAVTAYLNTAEPRTQASQIMVFIPQLALTHYRVLLEKLTGPQLVKKSPAFYGTRRYMTAFTSARQLPHILIQLRPVHTPKRTS